MLNANSDCRATSDERTEFESLVSEVIASLMIASASEVKAGVEAVLGRVMAFLGADRCGLLTVGADQRSVHVYAAAYGEGVSRVAETVDLGGLFPWTRDRLLLDRAPVVVPTMADLPDAAAADRASADAMGLRSYLVVPVVLNSSVGHLIVAHSVSAERRWPMEFVPRLHMMGELMVAAVQRQGREEELLAAHEEMKRLRDQLERENIYLRKEVAPAADANLVAGRSPAIRHALTMAVQVAPTASTVLLVGETGTGKERFATYLHQASPRRNRQMVRVNCSAIPDALIESELFGREKGAYTGALTKQIGRFELAQGSTIFLDEIGDLPLDVQVKLLRVLQERTIERLGSPTPIPVDVRIIAATNHDLEAAVRDGRFRSDLYYRLNVFPITVPPLRERREDIPMLVATLVDELAVSMRKRFRSIEPASIDVLQQYDWPGNVRELRNVLERAMILASGPTLTVAPPRSPVTNTIPLAVPANGNGHAPRNGDTHDDLQSVEREHILRVLQSTGWRIRGRNAAAAVLGLKPTTLEARMAKLGIHRPGSEPFA